MLPSHTQSSTSENNGRRPEPYSRYFARPSLCALLPRTSEEWGQIHSSRKNVKRPLGLFIETMLESDCVVLLLGSHPSRFFHDLKIEWSISEGVISQIVQWRRKARFKNKFTVFTPYTHFLYGAIGIVNLLVWIVDVNVFMKTFYSLKTPVIAAFKVTVRSLYV